MATRYQRDNQNPWIVLLWFTESDYPFGILWLLCCLFYFDSRILIIPLVSCGHCVVSSTLIDNTMATRYQRDNQNPWIKGEQKTQWPQDTKGIIRIRESFYFDSRNLITPLVSCGYCVVCSTLIHGFWLSLWIKIEQTTQWLQYIKGIIRIRESK
jgi:hypothetical protein